MDIKRIILAAIISIFVAVMSGCGDDPFAEPPLHQAAIDGDLDDVKQILNSGIGVNSKSKTGATALHWAAFKGNYDVAVYLLENGADVNASTHKGSTPLRLATTHKKTKLIKLLKQHGGR